MRRTYLPYYLSRAILSALLAILIMGLNWKAGLLSMVLFGFFVLYLHSGWFVVDISQPLTPLRRDMRAQLVQRQALIAAVALGLLSYLGLSQAGALLNFPLAAAQLALAIGVMAYFITQFLLLCK